MSVKEKKRQGEKRKPPAPHGPRPVPTQPASPPRSHLQSPVHRSLGGRRSLVHAADPPHVVHPPPPRVDKSTLLTPWQTLIPFSLSTSSLSSAKHMPAAAIVAALLLPWELSSSCLGVMSKSCVCYVYIDSEEKLIQGNATASGSSHFPPLHRRHRRRNPPSSSPPRARCAPL